MSTKIRLVLAAVLVLGAGSLAQADEQNDGGNETGGFVKPPSMVGVNPAYHPRWFAQYGRVMRAYGRADQTLYSGVNGYYPSAGRAYASARALARSIHRSQH